MFVTSLKGKKLVVLDGYTYSLSKKTEGGKKRWRCSTHHSKGCKANLYTIEDAIVLYDAVHNHHQSQYTRTLLNNLKPYFYNSLTGSRRLRLGQYSFRMQPPHRASQLKRRWLCATHSWQGCKALVITIDDEIVSERNEHNH
ncbi:hypothetical protein RR48_05195 [Papilio machaon]|uniref:FLYWCH-type domain-containing protein n=1 Tax=Papilio machaon TaxID=76193 RepID=A0A0N1IDW2_PAPMA|nr:hypothetical protein RR48_05195 [Papilio machaon]